MYLVGLANWTVALPVPNVRIKKTWVLTMNPLSDSEESDYRPKPSLVRVFGLRTLILTRFQDFI